MQPTADSVFDVDVSEFDTMVLERSRHVPVLVDLWADWCPPCRIITPIIEAEVRARHGRILLAKVEVDAGHNMKLAGRYHVRGFPTIILFCDGEEKARFASAQTRGYIQRFLDTHCPRSRALPPAGG
jgi:putative thioredoxin